MKQAMEALWALLLSMAAYQLWPRPSKPVYTPDGRSIAECEKCCKLLRHAGGVSLLDHVLYEHGLEPEAAYETIAFCYKRIDAYRAKRQNSTEVTNETSITVNSCAVVSAVVIS